MVMDIATSIISLTNGVLNAIEKRAVPAFVWILACAFWSGMAYIQYVNLKKRNLKTLATEDKEKIS